MNVKTIRSKSVDEIKLFIQQSMDEGFLPTLAIVFISSSQNRQAVCEILKEKNTFLDTIENLITKQIVRIRTTETSPKNSKLYFALLLETNDLIKSIMSLLELFKEFNLQNNKK